MGNEIKDSYFNLPKYENGRYVLPEDYVYSAEEDNVLVVSEISFYRNFNEELMWKIHTMSVGERPSFVHWDVLKPGEAYKNLYLCAEDCNGEKIMIGDRVYNLCNEEYIIKNIGVSERGFALIGIESLKTGRFFSVPSNSFSKYPHVYDSEKVEIKVGDTMYYKVGHAPYIVHGFKYDFDKNCYSCILSLQDSDSNGSSSKFDEAPSMLTHHKPVYTIDGFLIEPDDDVYGESDGKEWTVQSISNGKYAVTAYDNNRVVRDLKPEWLMSRKMKDSCDHPDAHDDDDKHDDKQLCAEDYVHEKFVTKGYAYCPFCGKSLN